MICLHHTSGFWPATFTRLLEQSGNSRLCIAVCRWPRGPGLVRPLSTASTAMAGEWFSHHFVSCGLAMERGFIRADKGRGACRTVQSYIPSGADRFFGKADRPCRRLRSVSLEIYDQGMPPLTSWP